MSAQVYLNEALGSFVFFLMILATGDPIMIAVGLLIGILIAAMSSQAHLNPAVTAMMYMKGDVNQNEALWYVGAQLIGAFIALQWYNRTNMKAKK
jgi:glycerol uptake facilitator-like aquaporin